MSWLSDKDLEAILSDSTLQETERRDQLANFVGTHFGSVCHHFIPHFDGVFPCDRLPEHRPGYRMCVINSDPHHKPGRHWLAYFQTPRICEFFDSMGRPMSTYPLICDWLRKALKQPVYANAYRLQGPNGLCGAYCYYYLTSRIHTSISSPIPVLDGLSQSR